VQRDLKLKQSIGLLVSLAIVILWIGSLEYLFFIDIDQLTPLWILPAVVGRAFIQTGLFIVAHDAIHGAVIPGDRRLNHWIGRLAVMHFCLIRNFLLITGSIIGTLVRWVIPTFTMEFTAISLSGI
jgi:beta-carotene/zeaxanthin 4-ketolase